MASAQVPGGLVGNRVTGGNVSSVAGLADFCVGVVGTLAGCGNLVRDAVELELLPKQLQQQSLSIFLFRWQSPPAAARAQLAPGAKTFSITWTVASTQVPGGLVGNRVTGGNVRSVAGLADFCVGDTPVLGLHDPHVLAHFALTNLLLVQSRFAFEQYDRRSWQPELFPAPRAPTSKICAQKQHVHVLLYLSAHW